MVVLGIHCAMTQAEIFDITELQQPDNTSPAMTGFYTVTPDGETTPEDPVKSGFAITAGSDFDPERAAEDAPGTDASGQSSEEASSSKKPPRKSRTVRIRVRRKPPEQNLADQFQCERHGLYYTNDGRCILPAYQHYLPAVPQPLPGDGIQRIMPK